MQSPGGKIVVAERPAAADKLLAFSPHEMAKQEKQYL